MAALVQFTKMNGLGNKIIVADMRGRSDRIAPEAVLALNASQPTSFDQIMVIRDPSSPATDQNIDILNSDASIAEACGNGTRCVVKALAGEDRNRDFTFETAAGIVTAQYREDGLISVDMGLPRFGWRDVPLSHAVADTRSIDLDISLDDVVLRHPSVVSMGNPHVIFWVDEDVNSVPLERIGPMIERHSLFPQRVNVTIAHVAGENELIIRTWERGAGLTLACGSAACAAAVSAVRTARTGRNVKVTVPGGDLWIRWLGNDHVLMTGPAEWEFSGTFDPETGAWTRDNESIR